MPEEKRRQFISQNRDKMDPEWLQAIIEMPPLMSGVMETDRAYLKDRELRRIHGGAVDELQTLELALEATGRRSAAILAWRRDRHPPPR